MIEMSDSTNKNSVFLFSRPIKGWDDDISFNNFMKEKIRNDMMKFRQKLGPAPLTDEKRETWISYCDQLKSDEVKTINKMIEKFNLIVPNMNNQMFLYNVEPDAEKIYNTHIEPKQKKKKPSAQSKTYDDKFTSNNHGNKSTFLSSVFGLFNK